MYQWHRVRHVPKRTTWHPAYDSLKGTQSAYGNSADDSQPWSLPWSTRDYDEIMLATGDWTHWLIVDKDELIGSSGTKYYSNSPIRITASSEQCDPYYCKYVSFQYTIIISINSSKHVSEEWALRGPLGVHQVQQLRKVVERKTTKHYFRNYSPDNAKALVMYGGYNNGGNNYVLNADHGGLDVYVRKKPAF